MNARGTFQKRPTREQVAMRFFGLNPNTIAQPAFASSLTGLGALGAVELVAGVKFENHDAQNDFVTGVGLRGQAGQWPGVQAGLLAAVDDLRLKSSQIDDPAVQAVNESFTAKAAGLARSLDSLQQFGFGGRSEAQDLRYRQTMEQLVKEMNAYRSAMNQAIQDAETAVITRQTARTTAAAAAAAAKAAAAQAGKAAADRQALSVFDKSSGGGFVNIPDEPGRPKIGRLVLYAVGGLVVLGVGFTVLRGRGA